LASLNRNPLLIGSSVSTLLPVPNRAWLPLRHHFPPRLRHLNTSFQGQCHTNQVFFQNTSIVHGSKTGGLLVFSTFFTTTCGTIFVLPTTGSTLESRFCEHRQNMLYPPRCSDFYAAPQGDSGPGWPLKVERRILWTPPSPFAPFFSTPLGWPLLHPPSAVGHQCSRSLTLGFQVLHIDHARPSPVH
jgi:hypothetical protein